MFVINNTQKLAVRIRIDHHLQFFARLRAVFWCRSRNLKESLVGSGKLALWNKSLVMRNCVNQTVALTHFGNLCFQFPAWSLLSLLLKEAFWRKKAALPWNMHTTSPPQGKKKQIFISGVFGKGTRHQEWRISSIGPRLVLTCSTVFGVRFVSRRADSDLSLGRVFACAVSVPFAKSALKS